VRLDVGHGHRVQFAFPVDEGRLDVDLEDDTPVLHGQVDAGEGQPDRGGGGDGELGQPGVQVRRGDVDGGRALAGVAGGVGLGLEVLAGVPTVYPAPVVAVRVTVSAGSRSASSTGVTETETDAEPAGIVTVPAIIA